MKTVRELSALKVLCVLAIVLAIVFAAVAFHIFSDDEPAWKNYPYSPPGSGFTFPDDDGVHDGCGEWWYLFFIGEGEDGGQYSIGLVYISTYSALGTVGTREVCFTDEGGGTYHSQIINGLLSASAGRLDLSFEIGGYRDHWCQKNNRPFEYELGFTTDFETVGGTMNLNVSLELSATKPPMAISRGSVDDLPLDFYYYTRMDADGEVVIDGIRMAVEGRAWVEHLYYDRDAPSIPNRWEWFGLQFDDGSELSCDLLYGEDSNIAAGFLYLNGANGTYSYTNDFAVAYQGFWSQDPDDDYRFSSGWTITTPFHDIGLTVTPVMEDQQLRPGHWEGSCLVEGYVDGVAVSGRGFVELTHRHHIE